MKTELHKRQVRAEQVARTTNELVESLANCVSRRDTLVNRLVLETELHYLLKNLVKFFCQGHYIIISIDHFLLTFQHLRVPLIT